MWFVFALLSALFAGLQAFLNKVAAERKCDTYHISASSSIVSFLAAVVLFLFTSSSLENIPSLLYWLALASGIFYVGRTISQLESLRFIDAAIFFPLYKVIGPAVVTLIGIVLLKDHISVAELVGIILSCMVPLLLITKAEHHRQKNLKLGLILMVISTVLAAFTVVVNALAVQPDALLTIPFMVIAYAFSAIIGVVIYARRYRVEMYTTFKSHCTPSTLLLGISIGLVQCVSFLFLLLAFSASDVSVVYSINAHSIVIPVILSVWLYKEHWNKQKAFALIVSILALILLHP